MDCLNCEHAAKYHDEFKDIAKKLRDAIREFEHGHFMLAIEEMEVVAIRLEQMHIKRMGR
jgi:hypothetical protein